MSRAGSDLVDAVASYLVVLHVVNLEEQGGVNAAGAGLKVFISGYPNLERDRRRDTC